MKKSLTFKMIGFIITGVIILTVYISKDNPYVCLYKYTYLYNNSKYEEIIPCFTSGFEMSNNNKEKLVSFLNKKRVSNGKIKLNNLVHRRKNTLKTKNILAVPITYELKPDRKNGLVLRKNPKTKKWNIRFPYKNQKNIKKEIKSQEKKEIKKEFNIEEEITSFIKDFNNIYIKAILNKDPDLINDLIVKSKREELQEVFKKWYINDKNVSKATSSMDIRKITKISPRAVEVSTLEVVEITNDEMEKDNLHKQEYKIVILWENQIIRYNNDWAINKRNLVQSIISYKDESGEWISYN